MQKAKAAKNHLSIKKGRRKKQRKHMYSAEKLCKRDKMPTACVKNRNSENSVWSHTNKNNMSHWIQQI